MSEMGQINVNRSEGAFCAVNPHCLENIVKLSDEMPVTASCDILDERGIKLWAKGAPVSRALQEKMLARRLKRPLEVSLDVEHGASMENVVDDCFALMKEKPALEALCGTSGAKGVLRGARDMRVPGPLKLLLTSAREHKKRSYESSLAAMTVCAGLANGVGLNDRDAGLLILSALAHDIGEMYINPDYLSESRSLQPDEWKHVASHPCVGQAFLREFTAFPPAVADCVLHHHERMDGSGYPFQAQGANLSPLSRLISVADSASAIVMRNGKGLKERMAVALNIVPEEFPRQATSFIVNALKGLEDSAPAVESRDYKDLVLPTLERVRSADRMARELLTGVVSKPVEAAATFAIDALRGIDKSLRATGVYELSQLEALESDSAAMAEICLVLGEVKWRLRNAARNIYLRTEKGENSRVDLASIAPLVAALNAESVSTN